MLKPVAASGKSKVVSNGTKRASGKASSGSNAGTFQGDYGSGREVTPAATSSMKHAVAKSARKSHLKITSLDSLTEYDPVLKYSQELLTKPSENAQRRAESAALWRALNMQPEDVLREVGRVQGLDNDMQVLRALTVKNQGSLLELKNRLQKAESEHKQVQYLLIKIGRALKYDVYVARNDRHRSCDGQSFALLTLPELPSMDWPKDVMDTVGLIDVIWLKPGTNEIVSAFEVEKSTSIYSGILLMEYLARSIPECT